MINKDWHEEEVKIGIEWNGLRPLKSWWRSQQIDLINRGCNELEILNGDR